MYVCLEACKVGFKMGCRPLIGVDGCHLKCAFPGMILVVVSKDGNNNIYLVAWAVVEIENKGSWIWFLELLIKDIEFPNGQGLTLTLDRQKGLLEEIARPGSMQDIFGLISSSNPVAQHSKNTFGRHLGQPQRCLQILNPATNMLILNQAHMVQPVVCHMVHLTAARQQAINQKVIMNHNLKHIKKGRKKQPHQSQSFLSSLSRRSNLFGSHD